MSSTHIKMKKIYKYTILIYCIYLFSTVQCTFHTKMTVESRSVSKLKIEVSAVDRELLILAGATPMRVFVTHGFNFLYLMDYVLCKKCSTGSNLVWRVRQVGGDEVISRTRGGGALYYASMDAISDAGLLTATDQRQDASAARCMHTDGHKCSHTVKNTTNVKELYL